MRQDNANVQPESLEQQLRRMMLDNVSIGNSQQNQNQQRYGGQQRQSQPNYRGRGNYQGYSRPQQQQYQSAGPQGQHQVFNNQSMAQRANPAQYAQRQQSVAQQQAYSYDSNSYQRGPAPNGQYAQQRARNQLWQGQMPKPQPQFQRNQGPDVQAQYLQQIADELIPLIEMTHSERQEKNEFRAILEGICRELAAADKTGLLKEVSLENFGSLASGFATKGSDMDLVVVVDNPDTEPNYALDSFSLPRKLEEHLLSLGYGARLLSRARVPIIKVCEQPTPELLAALREERAKWDALDEEGEDDSKKDSPHGTSNDSKPVLQAQNEIGADGKSIENGSGDHPRFPADAESVQDSEATQATVETSGDAANFEATDALKKQDKKSAKPWTREKVKSALDFPKDGVGIQSDINFFNPLGLYNTRMLRCYSLCDPRVRDMILFVKAWAKKRKINHPYSGTLSSYGYVLMVLHYLVNIANHPVLPNLQHHAEQTGMPRQGIIDGWEVRYYNDEAALIGAAANGTLTKNTQSVGALLKGFFQYYAVSKGYNFNWMQDVLSLRTQGGLLSKQEKGWTGAKTETTEEGREVRQRYLFAIEDPFELTHNVARTVTHNGIVAVRDEFRRAWRILLDIGHGQLPKDGQLFDELVDEAPKATDGEAVKSGNGFAAQR